MPKKLNFLGGMQNYNEANGEYEPALTGANGQVVKDADGDGVSHEGKKQTYDKMRKFLAKEGYPVDSYSDEEVDRAFTSLEKSIDAEDDKWRNKQKEKEKLTFEKVIKSADDDTLDEEFGKDTPERKLVGAIKEQDFNDPKERESLKEEEKEFNAPQKHDYSQIFDEDYQRSYGIPNFSDENDVKKLNDIVEKAMEYDGDDAAIDISNNAMDRIGELVSFTDEEQDKIASGTGEEIMGILRSKEKKNSFVEEVSDEDIEVELADHEWAVTDKTTVGEYAEMVGGILGVPKERVLEKIKARSSNELNESSLMYKVIDEDTGFDSETKAKDSPKSITYDEFFESPTNKQIVDDYVSDYFDRVKRQGEQANISADQIVEEFKKDWNGFYSEETLPLIKERIQDKIGYPKGTSKEYTQKINKQFDESYKTLKEKYGFTDEQLKSEKIDETIEGFIQGWENAQFAGGRRKWTEEEHKEIHSLLDVLDDKYYNDYYIRLAPRGY